MKKLLLLAACAALAFPIAAQAQSVYPKTAPIDTASAATVELSPAPASGGMLVFDTNFIAAGTTNITFGYGTKVSTPCDTGFVKFTGAYPLVAQAGMVHANPNTSAYWYVPAGQEFCMVNSAAIQVSGSTSWWNR